MIKLGILYIATGRYRVFWREFYESCERYLVDSLDRHYFVFTDSQEPLIGEKLGRVHRIYQQKLGWPYDTLMRFVIFLKAEKELEKMDYLFFFNANMQFVAPISLADLVDKQKPLTGALHPGFYNKPREQFTYDTNPRSLAYMSMGEGAHYFMGGLNGGQADAYLALVKELSRRIRCDLDHDVVALWHDESHLNRYLWEHRDQVHVLSHLYGVPEDWIGYSLLRGLDRQRISQIGAKIVIRNKAHFRYGGHAYLRGETNFRKSILKYILHRFLERS